MYPSIISENNIAPNTQIGRIEIDEKIYSNENVYKYETYSRGGEFVENMVTDNHIEFCHRWFGLANFEEMVDDMDEYYEDCKLGKFSELKPNAGLIPTSNYTKQGLIISQRSHHSPIIIAKNRDQSITFEKLSLAQINGG